MAFLGIKIKPLRVLGKIAKVAAPVLAATGVGAPLAAGIGLAGNVLDKGKRVGLKDVVHTGVGVAGGSLAGKALKGGSLLSKVGEQVGPSAGRSLLGRVADWVTADPLRAAQLGLGAVNAVQGAKAAGRANAMRQAALSRVVNVPQREDLSGIFADEGNPYSSGRAGTAKRAAVRALVGGY